MERLYAHYGLSEQVSFEQEVQAPVASYVCFRVFYLLIFTFKNVFKFGKITTAATK